MRYIPNQNSWVGTLPTLTGTMAAPKVADVNAAVDLTPVIQGITASSTGQAVPTPTLDSLFESSIPGTVSASFSMDSYRDDQSAADVLWNAFPRGTVAFIIIARAGGKPNTVGDRVEVWQIAVLSRSVPAMTSNTPVGCTVAASVPVVPAEDGIVAT